MDRTAVRGLHQRELDHAQKLADLGHDVVFLPRHPSARTPDVLINGESWELKGPRTGLSSGLVDAIRRAKGQSKSVHVDLTRSTLTRNQVEDALATIERRYRRHFRRIVVIEIDETGVDLTWEGA
ncbi:MAG: hypothetical protein U0990_01350 [Candidatus Nanopelagicales bacterium]|nr:hypothetical protein [Candidatus Nanopelagicales bacterium]MDZ4248716.1 hypothetical protein [Candidatus Nanopelagicales bacterium]